MAVPLEHDLVYGERKLAQGSTAITVPRLAAKPIKAYLSWY